VVLLPPHAVRDSPIAAAILKEIICFVLFFIDILPSESNVLDNIFLTYFFNRGKGKSEQKYFKLICTLYYILNGII